MRQRPRLSSLVLCTTIAKATIPDAAGDIQEWHYYAQTLFGESLLAMHKQKDHSVKNLLSYLTAAPRDEIAGLLGTLEESSASILCTPGNETMLSNTRAVMAPFLVAWRYLQDRGTFSVRDWVRSDKGSDWLFLTYRDDQFALLRTMIGTMLDLTILEGLSLDVDASLIASSGTTVSIFSGKSRARLRSSSLSTRTSLFIVLHSVKNF